VEHNPTDFSLQETNAALATEESERAKQTSIGDFKWVASNKRGRRFLHGVLEQAGVFRLSFTNDPCATAFNEGQRNTGLRVLALFQEHAPESYALMLSEKNG
jgi:hypothetical protein